MKLEKLKKIVFRKLKEANQEGLSMGAVLRQTGVSPQQKRMVQRALSDMIHNGKVVFSNKKYILSQALNLSHCTMTKVSSGFGFAENETQRFFIPGRLLKGAMEGDVVAVREISHNGTSPEGEVVQIIQDSAQPFVGTVVAMRSGGFGIIPDNMANFTFKVKFGAEKGAKEGDKVSASIFQKGDSHFDHMVAVQKVYGNAQRAQVCSWALLDHYQVKKRFDSETLDNAKQVFAKGVTEEDKRGREDYTDWTIFTIDSAESKDLDDAISLQKTKEGYLLGVHIADVSHYVTRKSPMDNEAYERGTSVYYADQVIPMLPKEISNGICSLNSNEEKLAFSALLELDSQGYLIKYDFRKSVISSKVKGVYSEINQILNGSADSQIKTKYEGLLDTIFLMDELADKLIANRSKRHALEIESQEAKIIVNENGDPEAIKARSRGKSEQIIEEFMVLANQASAKLSLDVGLPFLYRVHQSPGERKLGELVAFLRLMGMNTKELQKPEVEPKDIGQILENSIGKSTQNVIHMQVLRSMEKARYDTEEIGHFGLALAHYSHFTSPIRRYPDLVIHRILSEFVKGEKPQNIVKKYSRFVENAAKDTSKKEQLATECERACEDAYKAQYMSKFIGEKFEGTVNGVTSFGAYIALENTVEGLVKLEEFPKGSWIFHEGLGFVEITTGEKMNLGKKVQITVTGADVSLGQIDFSMREEKL